ncbi:hypothetical protein [Candidatus Palauibacter sp.]|uniref:hypothetical protein n=1 Tax=Candidatus Palauibacter sp. TaxID=3101350 RepID=UPI003B01DC80
MGDVTLDASVGWPPCPEVSASVSLREIKPGRKVYAGWPEGGRSDLLKEECIYLNDFETLDQAWDVIGAFIERYNGMTIQPVSLRGEG